MVNLRVDVKSQGAQDYTVMLQPPLTPYPKTVIANNSWRNPSHNTKTRFNLKEFRLRTVNDLGTRRVYDSSGHNASETRS